MDERFCRTCGTELEKLHVESYDQHTGMPRYKFACPSGKCGHTGIPHQYVNNGVFDYIFGAAKCKCGEIQPDPL